jgi:hypothetical protein
VNVDGFTGVFGAEAFLLPGFNISTVTTASICLFNDDFVSLMVGVFETVHTLNAAVIGGTVVALGNLIITNCYW